MATGIDVRMNYPTMEKMEKIFNRSSKQLDESIRAMQQISQQMEGGALLGDGGDAFREAINSKLVPRMKVLQDKMNELEQDIRGAVQATRDGVKTAQSRFK